MDENLKSKIDVLVEIIESLREDIAKSDSGVVAAGGRVRKRLQELKRAAQVARLFCLERDHARKSKPTT